MKPLKVSEVNKYIKRVFAGDMILSHLKIEGEVSNYKKHHSGHLYFSLKDHKSRIKCIMFRSDAELYDLNLTEGQKIVAKGYISIYEKGGIYQLYVREIVTKGIGELFEQFERLKKKLELEGLFDESFKKPIPSMPNKIGIVTSATGAVIKDIITVIKRRYPQCNILIYPSLVQGVNAPDNIIDGILYLEDRVDIDLIIIARGGGSIEELFAFNDENLARTIFSLDTPIISAVGHETDFSISDFVADLRAPTPSAAAELAVPDIQHLLDSLNHKYKNLCNIYEQWLNSKKHHMKHYTRALEFNSPISNIKDSKQELDTLFKDLQSNFKDKFRNEDKKLSELKNKLELLNPTLFIDKGYGIITDKKGNLINSVDDLYIADCIEIFMQDGSLEASVDKIKEGVIHNENR